MEGTLIFGNRATPFSKKHIFKLNNYKLLLNVTRMNLKRMWYDNEKS